MWELLSYSFMIRAFLAGGLIAVMAPLIGNYLVVKRFSLIADTLSHVALSGVAIGLLLHTQPLVTTLLVTILVALVIEKLRVRQNLPSEALLAMFLPGGLALSIVLLSLAKGMNTNVLSYLFGSIATVRSAEIWQMVALSILSVLTIGLLHKKLLFAAFDEESARISGVSVGLMNTLLLVLTAVTVSVAMRIVGALLVGALMVIPVVSAMVLAKSFTQSLWLSVLLAEVSVLVGLVLSYYLDLPAGGVIVLLSLLIFGLVSAVKKFS